MPILALGAEKSFGRPAKSAILREVGYQNVPPAYPGSGHWDHGEQPAQTVEYGPCLSATENEAAMPGL